MEKPRTLIIAPTAYPLGGVAVWLDYLINGLLAANQDVVFGAVAGLYHDPDKYLDRYPLEPTIVIHDPTNTPFGRVRAIKNAIRKINPSLVVIVNIADAYIACRQLKNTSHMLRVATTVHGLMPRPFSDLNEFKDCIDHVIVTNRLTELMVKRMTPFVDTEISYAPYGVEDSNLPSRKGASSPIRLLYCGRIEDHQKRCSDIIAIVGELEKRNVAYELKLAGDGPYKQELLRRLRRLVSVGAVVDLGVLNSHELVTLGYATADVLLVTSQWETGPIVVWEAMSAGVAIVTSRYIGLEAEGALEHRENCLIFDIGDYQGAVDCIQSLESDQLFGEITAGGKKLIENRYSREISVGIWSEAFKSINDSIENSQVKPVSAPKPIGIPNSVVEKIFGARVGFWIRNIVSRPAYAASGGDEWPHALAPDDVLFADQFEQALCELNIPDI